ncbi:MAG: methylated-DNA--[protein]-cysteine S-methyltransferase [Candidatus Firestonebacteria bacterium]
MKRSVMTKYGMVVLEAGPKGIVSLELSRGRAKKYNDRSVYLDKLERYLKEYFKGRKTAVAFPLDLKGTEFRKKVWRALLKIPYGETRSYAWVAKQAGNLKACRAAGNAVGKNPVAIVIPCHRVIRSDGSLGGFSSGLKWKRILHKVEKIV